MYEISLNCQKFKFHIKSCLIKNVVVLVLGVSFKLYKLHNCHFQFNVLFKTQLNNEHLRNKKLFQKWEVTAKSVAVLKNERPSVGNDQNGLEFEIKRLTERIEQLEKEDSDRHSRNLFSDLSDSKITLLEKEVEQLQKSVRFQLADSDTNRWLRQKQLSFLDTPDMNDKFKAQFRNFANTWVIQQKNLSKEVRELIVKVSFLFEYWCDRIDPLLEINMQSQGD